MDYKIEDIDITSKLNELELKLPDSVVFLPENLSSAKTKDEFIFSESMLELNKLFKQEQISVGALGNNTNLYRFRKNADLFLPAIFFGYSLLSENSNIVSLTLNVLSDFLYDQFKGTIGKKTTQVELYFETSKTGKIKKLSYNGNPEGLKDIVKIIKSIK